MVWEDLSNSIMWTPWKNIDLPNSSALIATYFHLLFIFMHVSCHTSFVLAFNIMFITCIVLFHLGVLFAFIITLDPRLPFPDSVGGIFPGPATTQGIEWFSQLAGLQWLTVLGILISVITITLTGDWHSGDWPPYLILSCYVTLFWLRVILYIFLSWECDDSPKLCFSS